MSPREVDPRDLSIGLMAHAFPVYSETFVAELARGLIGAGCKLGILALKGGASEVSGEFAAITQKPPRLVSLPGKLDVLGQALMLRRQPRYDVVHCQFATVGLSALRHLRLRTLRTRALVVHVRGYDVTTFVTERGADVYRTLFSRADLFVANCEHFRTRIEALGCPPEKIVVIGSPIDTSKFVPPSSRPPLAGRPVRLVAVGRLVEKKGFADAVAAAAILRDEGRDIRLDILGDGPLRDALRARIDLHALGEAVTLRGAASREGVIDALHRADIALAPSVRAASGDEDASVNTAKEAMATGLPVIATRHGGIPELVVPGENGDLVPERDPAALAAAIGRMIDDHPRWPALGAAGRRRVVTQFGRDPIVAKTLQAYRLALRRAGEDNE